MMMQEAGKMNRKEILDASAECITRDRAATHGEAEDNFAQIAAAWTWWLNERLSAPIDAYDVAQMMTLFKLARAKSNAQHLDNFVDGCGYLAIAAELGQAKSPAASPILTSDKRHSS
jgi:hypothetical protein